ncbi:MAG: hypothetical protein ACPL7B_07500 [Candidatus Poribacteria bacterium]
MLSDEEKRLIYEGEKEDQKKEELSENLNQEDEDKKEKIDQPDKRNKNIRKVDYYIIVLLLLILILTAGLHVVFYYYQTNVSTSPTPVPPSASRSQTTQNSPVPQLSSDGYKLKLLEWHWVIEQGYAIVEGEVQNISSTSLTNVNAVASFYDSNKRLIKSAENIIAYSPILAGQISLFRVKTIYSPDIADASIDFKYLNGESIPVQQVFQTGGM